MDSLAGRSPGAHRAEVRLGVRQMSLVLDWDRLQAMDAGPPRQLHILSCGVRLVEDSKNADQSAVPRGSQAGRVAAGETQLAILMKVEMGGESERGASHVVRIIKG